MGKHVVTSAEYARNSKRNDILFGLLIILFGLVTAICGEEMLNIIVLVAGALLIAFGLMSLFTSKLIQTNLILILIGVIFFILGYVDLADDVIRILFGLLLILIGVTTLIGNQLYLAKLEFISQQNKIVTVLIGLILVVLGVIAMINWGGSFDILIRAVGIILIAVGVIEILKAVGLVKKN